jgi:hypothetical protein
MLGFLLFSQVNRGQEGDASLNLLSVARSVCQSYRFVIPRSVWFAITSFSGLNTVAATFRTIRAFFGST